MNMLAYRRQLIGRGPRVSGAAFTVVEMMISAAILGLVSAGIVYGYAQANRSAEWSSMSQAAQSYALQGLEQVRGAKWDLSSIPVWDDIPAPTNYIQTDIMDIPVSGAPYYVTNYITITATTIPNNPAVQIRQVESQCVWTFPLTRQLFTNTVITYRAADRQ
jgi:type II secretory pathway pseudopilin PulG